ncbi:MAG: Lipoprotein signal peptidase [Burkholderiales bacterium]|jgi:signal peptidase II|nr:Lipoprotein signal peptidase [Burkholderiales bacterium]
MSRTWPWFALAAALVAVDQLTKWAVLANFAYGERLQLTGFFNLVLAYNKGAAFSMFAEAAGWQTPLLIGFALAASGIVAYLILRNPDKRLFSLGLALILGGAVGNLIDRLRFGYVVDFLDFHAMGWHWPAFNVADSGITVGAVILILEGFVHHERRAGAPS